MLGQAQVFRRQGKRASSVMASRTKLISGNGLSRLAPLTGFAFARTIPVRRLALRADTRPLLGLARDPFMFATLATITPNCQLNFGHVASILLASNIRQAKDFSCNLCTNRRASYLIFPVSGTSPICLENRSRDRQRNPTRTTP